MTLSHVRLGGGVRKASQAAKLEYNIGRATRLARFCFIRKCAQKRNPFRSLRGSYEETWLGIAVANVANVANVVNVTNVVNVAIVRPASNDKRQRSKYESSVDCIVISCHF